MNSYDLVASIREDMTWTPTQLWQEYGSSSAFAAELSGTTDRKSNVYKAALRNVERWIQGTRRPSKATQQKLNQLGQKFSPKPSSITLDGVIAVNGTGSKYQRDRTVDIAISEDEWEELQSAAEQGDVDGFMATLAEAYGVGSIELIDGDFDINEE